ncbi:uncharacterized protein YALI1_F15891g [Yarrowia lipolytica]|uniref:Uncharacterized protein n=1 Tax=Yarrowia lipolytica TaxID=4952 RepID=A0A1D8NN59_YARLL|nr:hypothetical protein YALI1_F15891g [Yarrowia lipolytica]
MVSRVGLCIRGDTVEMKVDCSVQLGGDIVPAQSVNYIQQLGGSAFTAHHPLLSLLNKLLLQVVQGHVVVAVVVIDLQQ